MESSRPSLDFLLAMSEPESCPGTPAGGDGEHHAFVADDDDDDAEDDDAGDDDSQREPNKDNGPDGEQQSDRTASKPPKSKKVRESFCKHRPPLEWTKEIRSRKRESTSLVGYKFCNNTVACICNEGGLR